MKQSDRQKQRREKFRKLGQALSRYDQAWAERRGEMIGTEYRTCKSTDETRAGPTVLQITPLYDRRTAKLKTATPEEQQEQIRKAEQKWERIKQIAAAREQYDYNKRNA